MNLDRLLNAQSIAIVGASATPNKASGMMLDFLVRSGYEGRIYPVNPRYEAIGNLACYPSVDALPEPVDIAVMVLPVNAAYEALEAAARKGVPFAVLTTGGYGEGMSGGEGDERRERIQELCRETGMAILGPNLIGLVNFRQRMPLVFADWYARDTGQRGGVAIVTHSGSVGGLIFSSLQINRVGVDFWIATGNEVVIETADLVGHLSDDPELHTIACFMEGVMDGRRFMVAAEKARQRGKNVVVLKAGDSPGGRRSTAAHTCKRSSDSEVYDAVFRQLGVVRVNSLPDLTQAVKILSTSASRTRGRVGLLSASGGACSVIADYLDRAGLILPILPESVQTELRAAIPEYGSVTNPVDVTADIISRREILVGTLAAIEKDETVDTWIVFGRPILERYHAEICEFAQRTGKTLVVCTGVPPTQEIEDLLHEAGVIVVHEPELCANALGAIHRAGPRHGGEPRDWLVCPPRAHETPLTCDQTRAMLLRSGLDPSAEVGDGDLIDISILQDGDFGPLLTIGDEVRGRRSLRALPLIGDEMREAVGEVVTHSFASAIQTTDSIVKLYLGTPSLSRIDVQITLERDSASVVAAMIWQGKEQGE